MGGSLLYLWGTMQGHKRSKGMSKPETGLQSLSQGSWKRVWSGEGWAGSSTWSSKNRTKVCGWMGYAVGDLRTSSGHGEVWIGVPMWCYMECNRSTNSWASMGAVMVSTVGTNMDCLVSQSTMMRIMLCPEDGGSFSMKSMEMEFQGNSGTGSCLSNP